MAPTAAKDQNEEKQDRSHRKISHRRRLEKNGVVKGRQALFFEATNETTIRAVTPESVPSVEGPYNSPGQGYLSSPSSGSTHRRQQSSHTEQDESFSNTDEDNQATIQQRRRAHTRLAAGDETILNIAPAPVNQKPRRRFGSLTTSPLTTPRGDETMGSIGFPSVIQPTSPQEPPPDRQMPRFPRRTFSPESLTTPTPGFRSPGSLDPDSTKILHLMKTTCGRMHGILFFRPTLTTAWASGWCAINVAPGSLVCQIKTGDSITTKTLIPDLRGCSVRTRYDPDLQTTYLSVLVLATGQGYQLRPTVAETFDSWLAALLCWQPLRPRGVHNKMTKPQSVLIADRIRKDSRQDSATGSRKGTAIIKVGKVLLWDGPIPSGSQLRLHQHAQSNTANGSEFSFWRPVSCTLHENGVFRLLEEADAQVLSLTPLSSLSRCAIQRLDGSVLGTVNCIGIYPHHTIDATSKSHTRPMILCFESRVATEAWFVLLRALTVPELYGPERNPLPTATTNGKKASIALDRTDMFRIERSFTVKVVELKLSRPLPEREVQGPNLKSKRRSMRNERIPSDVYVDIICGQDLRARTSIKPCAASAFWADEFSLEDLPSNLNKISVTLRMVNPGEREWTMIAHGPYELAADAGILSGVSGIEISSHDSILGKIDVALEEMDQQRTIDKWWPIVDVNERISGQMLMKISLQETVVLMSEEYTELSAILQNFSSNVTTHISLILGSELKHLSDILLDYYQSTDTVIEWINSLVEEEIDGTYREAPSRQMRFGNRLRSNDKYESPEQRELFVRDLSRSATSEANLLFRGNSLVTKALDSYMKRLGSEYLNDVLGPKLRGIVELDPDCEVDPTRLESPEQLERNWSNLIFHTNSIWKAVSRSAEQCPVKLRVLFKHIRSCAEDRYGSFIRTVKYTSVSGFLFLRFFCPAVLNPKLFGIIPDLPPDRVKRTFTLIAKSLNSMANMGKFGTKEPWMEPMNRFLNSSGTEFKAFIEEICAVSPAQILSATIEPQYAAPNQIRGRLPSESREGLPSLPYLLDTTKLMADLVNVWVTHSIGRVPEFNPADPLGKFHALCTELCRRSKECLSSAEQAEKPDSKLEPKWQEILTNQQRKRNPFEESFNMTAMAATMVKEVREGGLTALPQPNENLQFNPSNQTTPHLKTSPKSSLPAWDRNATYNQKSTEIQALTNSTNSSTTSFDMTDDTRAKQRPVSREGPAKNRLFGLMGSAGRRKVKHGDKGPGDHDTNDV